MISHGTMIQCEKGTETESGGRIQMDNVTLTTKINWIINKCDQKIKTLVFFNMNFQGFLATFSTDPLRLGKEKRSVVLSSSSIFIVCRVEEPGPSLGK